MTFLTVKACKCDQCGHEWLPSVDLPKQCAKCKSYKWNELGEQERPQKEESHESKDSAVLPG